MHELKAETLANWLTEKTNAIKTEIKSISQLNGNKIEKFSFKNKEEIQKADFNGDYTFGIVLTGGGSKLDGIVKTAFDVFNMPPVIVQSVIYVPETPEILASVTALLPSLAVIILPSLGVPTFRTSPNDTIKSILSLPVRAESKTMLLPDTVKESCGA